MYYKTYGNTNKPEWILENHFLDGILARNIPIQCWLFATILRCKLFYWQTDFFHILNSLKVPLKVPKNQDKYSDANSCKGTKV